MKTKKVLSTAVATVTAAAAAGTAAKIKKNNICPICEAKKLLNKTQPEMLLAKKLLFRLHYGIN